MIPQGYPLYAIATEWDDADFEYFSHDPSAVIGWIPFDDDPHAYAPVMAGLAGADSAGLWADTRTRDYTTAYDYFATAEQAQAAAEGIADRNAKRTENRRALRAAREAKHHTS